MTILLEDDRLPAHDVQVPRGRAIGGTCVGVIVIDAWYPMFPGNVASYASYNFPVQFAIVRGVPFSRIAAADPTVAPAIIECGQELVSRGCGIIVGACGSFANYQTTVAGALGVPTYLSVMMLAPLLLAGLALERRLGVVCAVASALTPKVFKEVGITNPDRLALCEAKGLPEFDRLLANEGSLNSARLEAQLTERVTAFAAANPDVGALLLQCSDLPPYAARLQASIGLPVFDMTTWINWLNMSLTRRPYCGRA